MPLSGFVVLDLTRVLSGPYASMHLGDLGADVVKVEDPRGGDDTRRFGPPFEGGEASYFLSVNRNKRSVAIDLAAPRGKELCLALAGKADVLVENFRPGVAERLGLGYAAVAARNPSLVYASISAYGHEGLPAYSSRPGYDLTLQAEGGIPSLTGPTDAPPQRVGAPIADLGGSVFAVQGILAALLRRERTPGRPGQHVDVALLDGQLALLQTLASRHLADGSEVPKLGDAHATIAPFETYRCRDGKLLALACGADRHFEKACEALGDPALSAELPRNEQRIRARDVVRARLDACFARLPQAEALAALEAAGVPCAPYRSVSEALAHPQARARGMVVEQPHPTAGTIRAVGYPVRLSASPARYERPPPLLGEHTFEVLREKLGLAGAELEDLAAAGVIGAARAPGR